MAYLIVPPLFRWTQPPPLSAGVDGGQRSRKQRVCSAHHAAPQQLAAQPNVFPQQGSRARPQTAARLYQCKTEQCSISYTNCTKTKLAYRPHAQMLICCFLLFFLQMQSDLFLARQRKPRNRQLRKPLVVQVREEQRDILLYLFCSIAMNSNTSL